MEQITLGEIGVALAFIVSLLGSINYLKGHLHEWISDSLSDQFQSIEARFDKLTNQMDEVDMNATKNFLVARLAEVEKGQEMDEIEQERFWEQYEHYHKIGGNSYIEQKVDKLKSLGRL